MEKNLSDPMQVDKVAEKTNPGSTSLAHASRTPKDRSSEGTIVAMPNIQIDMKTVPWVQTSPTEARPMVRLPFTGVDALQAPAGMSFEESFQWQLAMLLEGRASCVENLPSFKPGSPSYCVSRFLGWACRHSEELKHSDENWISLEWLLKQGRHKLHTPNDLFQAVIHNEKGRYQFSKPQYIKAQSRRETRGMGCGSDAQSFYQAKIYI